MPQFDILFFLLQVNKINRRGIMQARSHVTRSLQDRQPRPMIQILVASQVRIFWFDQFWWFLKVFRKFKSIGQELIKGDKLYYLKKPSQEFTLHGEPLEVFQKYIFWTTFHHHFLARNAKISTISHFDRGHNDRICHILCVKQTDYLLLTNF